MSTLFWTNVRSRFQICSPFSLVVVVIILPIRLVAHFRILCNIIVWTGYNPVAQIPTRGTSQFIYFYCTENPPFTASQLLLYIFWFIGMGSREVGKACIAKVFVDDCRAEFAKSGFPIFEIIKNGLFLFASVIYWFCKVPTRLVNIDGRNKWFSKYRNLQGK